MNFHRQLCSIRVLDPACGSGNFLYVALEHIKRLEGEVLETLQSLGETQQALEHTGLTVNPHQLLGVELNPRAAVIADLVLWIGYLQWYFRTRGDAQPPYRLFATSTTSWRPTRCSPGRSASPLWTKAITSRSGMASAKSRTRPLDRKYPTSEMMSAGRQYLSVLQELRVEQYRSLGMNTSGIRDPPCLKVEVDPKRKRRSSKYHPRAYAAIEANNRGGKESSYHEVERELIVGDRPMMLAVPIAGGHPAIKVVVSEEQQ